MGRVTHIPLWENDTGVVLSSAGNVFLEPGGQARCSWVQKRDYTGLGGTHVTGVSGQVINNATDTIRGWPAWRSEHVIPVNIMEATHGEGCDRLFIEWRGEVVTSSGFALGGGGLPTDINPIVFHSVGRCHATGTFTYSKNKSYTQEPPVIVYNVNQRGKMAAVFAGATQGDTAIAAAVAGGFTLTSRSFGHAWDITSADLRNFLPTATSRSSVPFDEAWQSGNLSQGALLWGITARGTGGTARFPTQGDQLGFAYEVGYEEGGAMVYPGKINPAINTAPVNRGPLSTKGLAHVWVTLWEGAPATKVAPWYLDFDNASMTVKGTITAILIKD